LPISIPAAGSPAEYRTKAWCQKSCNYKIEKLFTEA